MLSGGGFKMILVAGHKGFIGSHVFKRLSAKYAVIGADIKENVDLTDENQLIHHIKENTEKIDVIINCAGTASTIRSIMAPKDVFITNVVSTINLLELARRHNAKIIQLSSCKALGGDDGSLTPYGLAKKTGEDLVREWYMTYQVQSITNQLGTVYGPGQEGSPESGWIAWFTKAKKENKPVVIYGDGTQSRDILYIDDLVDLIETQIENFRVGFYSIGGGHNNTVTVNQIVEYLNLPHSYEDKRQGDAHSYVAKNDYILWRPKTKWEQGLLKTLEV